MELDPDLETTLAVSEQYFSIEVTTECNCACRHCFARGASTVGGSLPLSLSMEIIAQARQAGYRHLHITGGEPLLWTGLYALLGRAKEIGFHSIFMNTNGTLLTKRTSKSLAEIPGLSLSVSLEGHKSLHSKLRGKGVYDATLAGIGNALAAGLELFVFTTACRALVPVLPAFAENLYRTYPGVRGITLIPLVRPAGESDDLEQAMLSPADFSVLVQTAALLNLCDYKVRFLNDPLANVVSDFLGMPCIDKTEQLVCDGRLILKADRKFYPSHSSNDCLGHYSGGAIERILRSDEYHDIVMPDPTICPQCRFQNTCLQHGKYQPTWGGGDSSTAHPFCMQVIEVNTSVADAPCERKIA